MASRMWTMRGIIRGGGRLLRSEAGSPLSIGTSRAALAKRDLFGCRSNADALSQTSFRNLHHSGFVAVRRLHPPPEPQIDFLEDKENIEDNATKEREAKKEKLHSRFDSHSIEDLREHDDRKMKYNEEIPSEMVGKLILEGDFKGEMTAREALKMCRDVGMDLIIANEKAKPPIFKSIDFHAYLVRQRVGKLIQEKAKVVVKKLKQVRLSPSTMGQDLDRLLNNARYFLEHGHTVKVHIKFKQHQRGLWKEAIAMLDRAVSTTEDLGRPVDLDYKKITKDANGKIIMKPLYVTLEPIKKL